MEVNIPTNITSRLQTLARAYITITNELSQKTLNWETINNTRSAIRTMAAEIEKLKIAADLYSVTPHITEKLQREILHQEQQYALVQKSLHSAIVQCRKNENEQEIREREKLGLSMLSNQELRKRKATTLSSEQQHNDAKQVTKNLVSLNEKIRDMTTRSHNVTGTLDMGGELIDRIHHEYASKLPLALQGAARTLSKLYQRMQSDKMMLVIAMSANDH